MRLPLLVFALILLFPSLSNARYSSIAVEGVRFCGLLSNNQIECTAALNPQPLGLQDYSSQPVQAIDLSASFACAITEAGQLDCWGVDTTDMQLSPPIFDNPVTSLSLSYHHACAVDDGGTVKCWGQNVNGQTDVPESITDFVDVSTFGYYNSCGVRRNGEVLCWGRNSNSFLPSRSGVDTQFPSPFKDIEYTPRFSSDISCGIRTDGTATCWNYSTNQIIAEFTNGPYIKTFPLVSENQYQACALTVSGEMDCVLNSNAAPTDASTVRLPELFIDADSSGNYLYGYTTEGRLVSISNNIGGPLSELLDVVNGEIDMPNIGITDASYYGGNRIELFFEALVDFPRNYQTRFDVEIFRDDELIVTTDNRSSFVDNGATPGETHSYTARTKHPFGQVGSMSSAFLVTASRDDIPGNDASANKRPFSPQNLRSEVYWRDVELFWDRDFTVTVKSYEIRRDGKIMANTRGISWYDNSTQDGQSYQYDVLAIGQDDAILGIETVHVQVGPAECR